MNLQTGSTVNGYQILHTGNHNKLEHKDYAIDNNYIILPKKVDDNNYAKICTIRFNKNSKYVKIMYDLDIINITSKNETVNLKVSFIKENNEVVGKISNVFYTSKEYRLRSYHSEVDSNTQAIESYMQIDDDNTYIVKCNKYIHIEDGELINKESEFYFSKATKLTQAPSSSVVEFANYNTIKLYNNQLITFSEPSNLLNNVEADIHTTTIQDEGVYKINYKNAIAKPTSDALVEVKIYVNNVIFYQQTLRIDNKTTNIHDVFYSTNLSKNSSVKITLKNLSTETLATVPVRMQLLVEKIK